MHLNLPGMPLWDAAFRPLLKWPGGKTREWDAIAPCLPRTPIRTFVDPFCGGLAPFALTPFTGSAYLNDAHVPLADLYARVRSRDAALLREADALAAAWDALGPLTVSLLPGFRALVGEARAGRAVGDPLDAVVAHAPDVVPADARPFIADAVADKARRLAALERRHGTRFEDVDLADHGETAVRGGFYFFVREREQAGGDDRRTARRAADFLFVREYCYGSMFRHNKDGQFNIPYGGGSYNGKRFADRAAQLRAPETRAAFDRATFSCGDFEPFLAALAPDLGRDDFVFADPPYDSEFSSYGTQAFGPDDHRRLATALGRLRCPWLLVIKETPFVRATYLAEGGGPGREVHAFGKTYGYNVRGRNDRDARHLQIAGGPAPRTP